LSQPSNTSSTVSTNKNLGTNIVSKSIQIYKKKASTLNNLQSSKQIARVLNKNTGFTSQENSPKFITTKVVTQQNNIIGRRNKLTLDSIDNSPSNQSKIMQSINNSHNGSPTNQITKERTPSIINKKTY
jgi:hypothetical protein